MGIWDRLRRRPAADPAARLDERALSEYLAQLDAAVEAGHPGRVRTLQKHADRQAPGDPEVPLAAAESLLDLALPEQAAVLFGEALRRAPEEALIYGLRAAAWLDMGRCDEARADIERALQDDADCAPALYAKAILCDLEGRWPQAERNYHRAAGLDPNNYPAPIRLPRHVFDRVVRSALAELPPQVDRYLTNVVVAVRDMPRLDDLRDSGLSPLLLGLFEGAARAEHSGCDAWSAMPATILLFQRNLERICQNRSALREQIRITVLHEVLHYFGLTEAELSQRGLE